MNSFKYLFAVQYLGNLIRVDNLNTSDLKKLNKLSYKSSGIEFIYSLGKIYTLFLQTLDIKQIDPQLLLEVQNIIYSICESLSGTRVSCNLASLIQKISN